MKSAEKCRLDALVVEVENLANLPATAATRAFLPVLVVGISLCLLAQFGPFNPERLHATGYVLLLLSAAVALLVQYAARRWVRRKLLRLLSQNPDLQPIVSRDLLLANCLEKICGNLDHLK